MTFLGLKHTEETKELMRIASTGKNHHGWKGGIKHRGDGYLMHSIKDHPYANIDGYITEHRLILENKLGRYLESNEVSHHINGDILDNNPENLQVLTKSEHAAHHNKMRKRI